MRWQLKFFLILILAGIPAYVNSFPAEEGPVPPEERGFFMGKMIMEVLRKIDLTEDQKEKIKNIHQEEKERIKGLRKEMWENMKKLKDELSIYNSDEKRVNEIIKDINKIGAELFESRINTFIKMKKILSPAQFETFKKEMEKKKEEMRERFRKHRGMEMEEPGD